MRAVAGLLLIGCGSGAPVGADTAQPVETADDTAPPPADAWPGLRVNEVMASNRSTVQDAMGSWPDWIELHNPTDETVDLAGWTISDDPDEPDHHTLDPMTIASGGFLVLWADADPEDGPDHLAFNLDVEGDSVGLYAPDGTPVDGLSFGRQATDIALARIPDGAAHWTLTADPSPAASNRGSR